MGVVGLLLGVLAGCANEVGPPDLVLITVDGWRADGPSPGAEAALTEAAGLQGTRYTRAWAQTPNPYVATGSLLTGVYPTAIPLCSSPNDSGAPPPCVTLPPERPTLPEVLGIYGYHTARFERVASAEPAPTTWRGFSLQRSARGADGAARAATLTEAAAWWYAHADAPRFLSLALPVLTPEVAAAAAHAVSPEVYPPEERATFLAEHPEVAERLGGHSRWVLANEAGVGLVTAAYVESARAIGQDLGRFLAGLPATRPRYVILTSSWGLTLGELDGTRTAEQAGPATHELLLDRILRVPLLLSGPNLRARDVAAVVELVDLYPTLAALAGVVPPAGLSGTDLLAPPGPGPAYAHAEYGDMFAVRDEDALLLFRSQIHGSTSLDPEFTTRLTGRPPPGLRERLPPALQALSVNAPPVVDDYELYDLTADPLQTIRLDPLAAPDDLLRLYLEMVAWRTGPDAPPPGRMGWDEVQQLRRQGLLHYF